MQNSKRRWETHQEERLMFDLVLKLCFYCILRTFCRKAVLAGQHGLRVRHRLHAQRPEPAGGRVVHQRSGSGQRVHQPCDSTLYQPSDSAQPGHACAELTEKRDPQPLARQLQRGTPGIGYVTHTRSAFLPSFPLSFSFDLGQNINAVRPSEK